eukprot:gene10788-14485_t
MRSTSWTPGMVLRTDHTKKTFSIVATLNYMIATLLQYSLILVFLHIFQIVAWKKILKVSLSDNLIPIFRTSCLSLVMIVLSLRSRIFSPLDNSRPSATKDDPVFKNRLRPSWQPPPFVFPIVWSIITILRVVSSVLIAKSTGTVLCPPIFAIAAHLSIGDTWNTINNVDNRLGTAALGVLFVLASAFYATYTYYKQLPIAGIILAPSCVWLSVATALVFSIWRVNMKNYNNPTFFPSVEEAQPSRWKSPFNK